MGSARSRGRPGEATLARSPTGSAAGTLPILPGAHALHLPAVALVAEQRSDVDDALALLARDPSPVVRVGRVGEVLVLLELVPDRREEIVGLDALLPGGEETLDGVL